MKFAYFKSIVKSKSELGVLCSSPKQHLNLIIILIKNHISFFSFCFFKSIEHLRTTFRVGQDQVSVEFFGVLSTHIWIQVKGKDKVCCLKHFG